MRRLLCRLGIHTPTWQPAYRLGLLDLGWLQLRTCRHCGHQMRRRTR